MAQLSYKASDYKPQEASWKPMPEGWYLAHITECVESINKKGTGKYLKLTIKIIGEKYKGRSVWHYINHEHDNPKVVEIAGHSIHAICRALKIEEMKDTAQWLNKPLMVKLGIQFSEFSQDDENKVMDYASREEKQETVEKKKDWDQSEKFEKIAAEKPAASAVDKKDDEDVPF